MRDNILEACNTGLQLGLGLGEYPIISHERKKKDNDNNYNSNSYNNNNDKPVVCLDLSFSLCPKREAPVVDLNIADQASSLKKKVDHHQEEENGSERSDRFNNKICARKKLRLTKEQSALLEGSFKRQSNLNPVYLLLISCTDVHENYF